jgi:hypothetical protein
VPGRADAQHVSHDEPSADRSLDPHVGPVAAPAAAPTPRHRRLGRHHRPALERPIAASQPPRLPQPPAGSMRPQAPRAVRRRRRSLPPDSAPGRLGTSTGPLAVLS